MKIRKFAIIIACTFSFSCFIFLNFFVEKTETAYSQTLEEENEDTKFFAPDLKIVESFFKVAKTALHPIAR